MRAKGPAARRRAAKRRTLMAAYKRACKTVDEAGFWCQKCGTVNNLQHHHIKPRSTHPELLADPSNIILLCVRCHARVHGRF